MIASIHAPRTAGGTIGYVLRHSCRQRVWMYYPPLADGVRFAIDPADRDVARRHRDFVAETFDYVHGCFPHAALAGCLPPCSWVASLRHPVDRIISHFHAYRRAGGDRGLSLLDFAARGDVANMQSAMIDGLGLDGLTHVFLVERLAQSVQVFARKNPWFRRMDEYCMAGLPRLFAAAPPDETHDVDPDTRAALGEMASDDMELYAQAQQRCLSQEDQYL